MRLLLVEKQTSLLMSQICDDGTVAVHAHTLDAALSTLRQEMFDLVVIDMTSFLEGGFAFIRQLRAAGNDTPLVALTGRHADDRVRALGLGADDVMPQPIDLGELRARIAAISRRHKGYGQSLLRVGALSLSLESRLVRFRNIRVGVTPKEYSMLELLVLRQGQVTTKEMFLDYLYGGIDEQDIRIIDVFICALRRKLIAIGADCVIGTVWGQGYIIRTTGETVSVGQARVSGESSLQFIAAANRIDVQPVTRPSGMNAHIRQSVEPLRRYPSRGSNRG